MGGPLPGWYPDPEGSGLRRYFDGRTWGPLEPPAPKARQLNVSWASHPVAPGYSDRSRVIAGLLQLLFGSWGVGRFYLGYQGVGGVQLALGISGLVLTLLCGIGLVILVPLWIWNIVEAAMMIGGGIPDADGKKLR